MAPTSRSPRGERRRRLLVEAAAQVVLEAGFAGASHRSIARRAGLPLASTTYYFASLDDLLAEALANLAVQWSAAAREALDRAPKRPSTRQCAALVLDLVALAPWGGSDGSPTVFYERYLEAARHPHLRPLVRDYDRDLDALVLELLRRTNLPQTLPCARVVVATADGALVRSLAEGTGLAVARQTVRTLLELVADDDGVSGPRTRPESRTASTGGPR